MIRALFHKRRALFSTQRCTGTPLIANHQWRHRGVVVVLRKSCCSRSRRPSLFALLGGSSMPLRA